MQEVKYLVKVDAGSNNNKFYRLIPCGNSFRAEYGRLGNDNFQSRTYPMAQWDAKLREKLGKGYVDQSHLILEAIVKSPKDEQRYKSIADTNVADIVERLQSMARQVISENYRVSSNKVTRAMLREAQQLINQLVYAKNEVQFNTILEELFAVIPRKMNKVHHFLAQSDSQFGEIIAREQSLLDVMAGQVGQDKVEQPESKTGTVAMTILDALGLTMRPVTDKEADSIKKMLGMCAPGYVNAWRVENLETRKRYKAFLEENKIQQTMLLFHGSRNENWFNIIQTGLVLRPTNAVITGKMFGYGTYFATKAIKSRGYTSLRGARWTRGTESLGFMALYDVATGKQFDVHSHKSEYCSFDMQRLQASCPGANCLFAHKGSMLHEDEIIVYDEAQTTIKFLVELRDKNG